MSWVEESPIRETRQEFVTECHHRLEGGSGSVTPSLSVGIHRQGLRAWMEHRPASGRRREKQQARLEGTEGSGSLPGDRGDAAPPCHWGNRVCVMWVIEAKRKPIPQLRLGSPSILPL